MKRQMDKYQKELKMKKEKGVCKVKIKKVRGTEGITGCPGCSAVKTNMAFQPHAQECKSRFENILQEEAK
eukprot:11338341-Karenia_brevis.AAC.1